VNAPSLNPERLSFWRNKEEVIRRIISGIVLLVVGLPFCSMSMAQQPPPSTSWDACLKAPTRACILDEALVHALAIEPSQKTLDGTFVRSTQLAKIAEAQAAAGNVQAALRIAQLIPSGQASRVTAWRSIAGAQARLRMESEAKETFTQTHQLADALADQLSRAEVLYSLAQGKAEARMAAKGTNAFEESLKLAETVAATPELLASSPCMSSASAETRLDGLLKVLAEQQARAGSLSDALRAVRSIKYALSVKAEALQAIAEIQARRGLQNEARLILKEALEAVHASQTPIEYWPSCPKARHLAATKSSLVDGLCAVAKAQARAGLNEDAAATLEEALQVIPAIEDNPVVKADTTGLLWFLKADVEKIQALSAVAVAQNEAGFQAQSGATLERAMGAVADLSDVRSRISALITLGRTQYQVGRVAEATGAFDTALELARARDDDDNPLLWSVLDAQVAAGLTADAEVILVQKLETARSIADESRRVLFFSRIAWAQEKMGRHEDAVATYREALETVDAITDEWRRSNMFGLIQQGALLVGVRTARLIAESAPQVARIAQSIQGELRRSDALVVIANALPN
jgi:tetratricopeptide (TPR) repeat protein